MKWKGQRAKAHVILKTAQKKSTRFLELSSGKLLALASYPPKVANK